MASAEQLEFNEPHVPKENALTACTHILHTIKSEIVKSRHHWDQHEPKMWSRAHGISDHELAAFTIEKDLVLVRSAPTSYGTVILGKIRIPAIDDGYIHIRIHDPPNRGTEDVIFHSLWTNEIRDNPEDDRPTRWEAIQTKETKLEFFNE